MNGRGTRGAYRKEDRVALPPELQKELVEKAAAKYGNCQELAKHLNIPKSSVHYYLVGRLTMPVSLLEDMMEIAEDEALVARVESLGIVRDRMWAIWRAKDVYIQSCKARVRLPTRDDLEHNDDLRRSAAAVVSYVLAEGSVWMQKQDCGEYAANITFADHETDLFQHFRNLMKEVFDYEIGPPQRPGNDARAIRGFIYSRFVAEWLIDNGVPPGDKSAQAIRLPKWIMNSRDPKTWTAALQPWCDGEGCVSRKSLAGRASFSIAQSRHTDLDCHVVPSSLITTADNGIPFSVIRELELFGIRVSDHCLTCCKSEVLEDVRELFNRLGFSPRMDISRLHLKSDGFWSCIWGLRFGVEDTERLGSLNLITQEKKRRSLNPCGNNIQ